MIAVEDRLRQTCSASDGFRLVKGIDEYSGVHRIAHLVTKNPPRTGIHDAHQVEPPLFGPDVGQVADPEHVDRINGEVPLHEIIALPGMTIGPRRDGLEATTSPLNAKLSHQTAHGGHRNVDSTAPELVCEPWGPIDAPVGPKGLSNALLERFTGLTGRLVDLAPLVVPPVVTRV
jgi:hypothetical protein